MIQPEEAARPLTPRVARGALWITASRFAGRVFDLLKALILARLLKPADFGLFGIVMLALATLDILSQTGINAALVQRRGDIRPYLGTAWTIQLARGIGLAGLLYVGAPMVAHFFREPAVTGLLRFVGLVLVVQGFINTGTVFFARDLDFQRSFIFEVASAGLSLATGIVLAYQLRSPWALVWANLVGTSAKLVLSFVLSPVRPRLEFVRERAGDLVAFGKWMSGYAIAMFVWQNVDRLVVGRMTGAVTLGLYQMAHRIANMPVSEVAVASMGVTLPAYAKIQDQPERLGRTFLDTFETIMSLVAPTAVFLAVAAPEVVYGLLGEQWAATIRPLQIISAGALFTAVDVVATPLFIALGLPKVEFWKNVARSAVVATTVIPLTAKLGLTGACVSFLLGALSPLPAWIYLARIVHLAGKEMLARLLGVAALCLAVPCGVWLTRMVVGEPGIVALVTVLVVCTALGILSSALQIALGQRGLFTHLRRLRLSLR